MSVKQLQNISQKILNTPGDYIRRIRRFNRFNNVEQQLLNAYLNGESVKILVVRMHINSDGMIYMRHIFRIIELRNRNKYAFLMGQNLSVKNFISVNT